MANQAGLQAMTLQIIAPQINELDSTLQAAIDALGLELDDNKRHALIVYLDKLLFWNKAYNLTAIRQPKEALIKHIIDCLAIMPHLKAGKLLDIGTGAGLPGVIVAICQPERQVTVLDSNQKKIRFIKQLISDLKISNVTAIASRIENFTPVEEDKFDVVTSRAFASLIDFVDAAAPRLAKGGCLQAMKGLIPEADDREPLVDSWDIEYIPLSVPYLNETRHLINLFAKQVK